MLSTLAGFAFSKCLLVFDFFTQKGCEKLIKLLNGSHGLRGQFLYGCFLCPSGGSIYLWRFLPKEMGFNLKDCNKKQTTKFIFKRWNQKSKCLESACVVVLNLQFHFLMREILNSNKNDHLSVTGWRTSNIWKKILHW